MTPEAIALRSRLATHARVAKYGGEYLTREARKVAHSTLNQQLIEQWGIPEDAPDFQERLEAARSLHFSQKALKRWRGK